MARVLFINPVVREEDDPRHVPYGMALLSAIAMQKGHQVQVYDQNAWRYPLDTTRQVLQADEWTCIAVGGITTAYASIKKIVKLARETCPKAVIVMGGGVLTSIPEEMMELLKVVDVGVVGEAFVTFPEILDMIDHQSNEWSKIAGTISWNSERTEVVWGAPRGLIPNLDVLPYPAWDLFPIEEIYFKNSSTLFSEEGMLAKRRLDINGSYGCSLICKFCYHLGIAGDMRYETADNGRTRVAFDEPGKYTRTIRYHSPEYIVNLALHARRRWNVDFIGFLDENLMTMDRYSKGTWLKEICRLWIEAGLQPSCIRNGVRHDENCSGVHWSGTSHATLCNREIMQTMRNAGCSHLLYGYESFAPHVLKMVGKGATPKTNLRSFYWTLESGIRPIPNQMIGLPNEDFLSVYQNMAAWKRLGIVVKPFFATPYPGSEWFTTNRKRIMEQYNGDLDAFLMDLGDATRVTAVISKNFNAVELLGIRELMITYNYRKLREYEREWNARNGILEVINIEECDPLTEAARELESGRAEAIQ